MTLPLRRSGTNRKEINTKEGKMEEGVPEVDNLMRPKPVVEKNEHDQKQEQKQKQEEESGFNVGILKILMSNYKSETTSEDCKSGENIQRLECEDENEKKKDSSSGGILDKIISHIPEDAVPTTDEAAILIHSAID